MDESFEGETLSRRRFVALGANTAGAAAAAAFALPALGFAIAPVFQRESANWQPLGAWKDFSDREYRPVVIRIASGIGEAGRSLAYVRRRNRAIDGPPKDRYDRVVAISSRCAHVGCPVNYVAAARSFVCPCHGGVYDFRGLRVGGPPPRPLDRFYTLVRNGRVLLGPRYSVDSHLRRYSPRDPGEALDGIGHYIYPARFSTAKAPPDAKP